MIIQAQKFQVKSTLLWVVFLRLGRAVSGTFCSNFEVSARWSELLAI